MFLCLLVCVCVQCVCVCVYSVVIFCPLAGHKLNCTLVALSGVKQKQFVQGPGETASTTRGSSVQFLRERLVEQQQSARPWALSEFFFIVCLVLLFMRSTRRKSCFGMSFISCFCGGFRVIIYFYWSVYCTGVKYQSQQRQ